MVWTLPGCIYETLTMPRRLIIGRGRCPIVANIAPIMVLKVLILTILALVVLDVLATGSSRAGFDYPSGIQRIFDLDAEGGIATWFSSTLLLACALPLFLIAAWKRGNGGVFVWHWLLLGLLFVGLSIDESISVHEGTIGPVRDSLGVGGALHYAWVVPALAVVVVLGVAYLPFLRHLEPSYAMLFAVSGAIYVGGAAGFEMFEGMLAESNGTTAWATMAVQRMQETLEMSGAALFLFSLLRYIREVLGIQSFVLAPSTAPMSTDGEGRPSPTHAARDERHERLGGFLPDGLPGAAGGLQRGEAVVSAFEEVQRGVGNA